MTAGHCAIRHPTTPRIHWPLAGILMMVIIVTALAPTSASAQPEPPTPPLAPTTQAGPGQADTDETDSDSDQSEPPTDDVAVSAMVGIDGAYKPGLPVPVVVSVRADRLVDGELRVTSRILDSEVVHELPIEVPGGSTKEFTLLMPTPSRESPTLRVEVIQDGTTVGVADPAGRSNSNEELVGVLPLVATAETIPASTTLAVDAGTARLMSVTDELLAQAPEGLAFLDTVIATAADLDAIDPTGLLAWVQAGGHLVLDEASGSTSVLPAAWQPAPGLPARAGLGQVRLSEGRAKAGRWDTVVYPTPIDSEEAAGDLNVNLQGFNPVESDLTVDAGFSLPSLGSILAFLALYVLAVGPIAFVALRSVGRPTLLWILIPTLALLATAGVFFVGADLRQGSNTAHATMIQSGPVDGRVVTLSLVPDGRPGLELDSAWTAFYRTSQFHTAVDMTTRTDGPDSVVEASVPPGGFAVVGATGTASDSGLTVTAIAVAADEIVGTVTNNGDRSVRETAVFGSSDVDRVGRIDPGQTVEYSLRVDASLNTISELQSRAWGNPFEFGNPVALQESPVSMGAWAQFRQGMGPLRMPVGDVWAVGWTREREGPVDVVGGGPPEKGRTGIFVAQPVSSGDQPAHPGAFAGTAVRGPIDTQLTIKQGGPDEFGPFGGQLVPIMTQIVLPARPESGRIGVELTPGSVAEIYLDEAWTPVEPDETGTAVFSTDAVAPEGLLHLKWAIDLEAAFAGGSIDSPSFFDPASREDQ